MTAGSARKSTGFRSAGKASGVGLFSDIGGELAVRLGRKSHLVEAVSDEAIRASARADPEGSRIERFKASVIQPEEQAFWSVRGSGDLDPYCPIWRILDLYIPPVAADVHEVTPIFTPVGVGQQKLRPAALQELPGEPRVRSDRDKECGDLLPLPLGSASRESSCAQGASYGPSPGVRNCTHGHPAGLRPPGAGEALPLAQAGALRGQPSQHGLIRNHLLNVGNCSPGLFGESIMVIATSLRSTSRPGTGSSFSMQCSGNSDAVDLYWIRNQAK